MIAPQTFAIVNINDCLVALGHAERRSVEQTEKLIEQHGIEVVSTVQYGKGIGRFMRREQMEELVRKHQAAAESAPARTGNETELHLGALEAKTDRLTAAVTNNEQATALLIQSQNRLIEKLDAVLKQLGAA